MMGRMIYKDECCKCFNNPKTSKGLNVCLKTLVGYCVKESCCKNYVQLKQNYLFLNIEKTPTQNQDLTKVTKLAIGKPGGIDAEQDKYDTKVKVICYKCNVKLDHENAKVKPIVDSILLANSAFEANAV